MIPFINVLFSFSTKVTDFIPILSKKCTLYLLLPTKKTLVILINRLFPVASGYRTTCKCHKLEHRKFSLNMDTLFIYVFIYFVCLFVCYFCYFCIFVFLPVRMIELVSQRRCGVTTVKTQQDTDPGNLL